MIVYHGSWLEVKNPDLKHSRSDVDFGKGFYVTPLRDQAVKWCGKFKRRGKQGIVTTFEFEENAQENLKILKFDSYSEEWLDFVARCRQGIEHNYDIVEGPMADDQIWNYVEDFTAGKISRTAFWELVKFNYPTHQIVFCTERALQTLTFKGSEKL